MTDEEIIAKLDELSAAARDAARAVSLLSGEIDSFRRQVMNMKRSK